MAGCSAIFGLGAKLTALLTARQHRAVAESIAEPSAADAPLPSPPPRTLPIAAAAIPGAVAALFALQNGSPITLRFLAWAAVSQNRLRVTYAPSEIRARSSSHLLRSPHEVPSRNALGHSPLRHA